MLSTVVHTPIVRHSWQNSAFEVLQLRAGRQDVCSRGGLVTCAAKAKGQAYYDKYKANRARYEGVLLPEPRPPLPGGVLQPVGTQELQTYIQQELWAYMFGQPSPLEQPLTATGATSTQQPAPLTPDTDATEGPGSSKALPARAAVGVIIPPPDPSLLSLPTAAIPPIPVAYNSQRAQVYVFWDLGSKHPGDTDPRLVAHRLRQLAAMYGSPAGLYAYAVRKDWNWVPEAFLQYRSDAAGQIGSSAAPAGGGRHYICAVCGVSRRTAAELQAHVKAVHPAALLPASETAGMAAGSPPNSVGSHMAASAPQPTSASISTQHSPNQPAAMGRPGLDGSSPTRNTSRRTLGKVVQYYTAQGAMRVPPAGHQLSLKYCISQEGWEARIVQNAAEAESVAVASGMGRLLDRIRRGQMDVAPGDKVVVLLVSDDAARLQQPLLRLRGIGGAVTLAVTSSSNGTGSSGGKALGRQSSRAGVKVPASAGAGTASSGGFARGVDAVISWEQVVMAGLQ